MIETSRHLHELRRPARPPRSQPGHPRGESLVVIGPRAAAVRAAEAHHWPPAARLRPVRIDGEDIYTKSPGRIREVRRRFGMLFQSAALFDSMTVAENVGLGLLYHSKLSEAEIRAKASDCLRRVGRIDVEEKSRPNSRGE